VGGISTGKLEQEEREGREGEGREREGERGRQGERYMYI
jgi:hypothetical protein